MNAYPNKPATPYEATSVPMQAVVAYLKAAPSRTSLRCCAYTIFRIESGNGAHGINNNYGGFQADGARWPAEFDGRIVGVVGTAENGTGRQRLFVAFDRWESSVDLLLAEFQSRGLYLGGQVSYQGNTMTVGSVDDLAAAYHRVWVRGDWSSDPSVEEAETFRSIYAQAEALFGAENLAAPQQPVHTAEEQTADDLMAAEQAGQPIPGTETTG